MTLVKTLWFALRNMSQYSLHYAGAELCGGDTRRAKSDAYRHLKNMSSDAVQAQVYELLPQPKVTAPAQDRP